MIFLDNPHFKNVSPRYLFPEVSRRREDFEKKNPEARVLSLSIGDTSEPIPSEIAEAMAHAASLLGTYAGYMGYGPEAGNTELREAIAQKLYLEKISADEVFISDGAKCDLGRLQMLFGSGLTVAIQDPAYPVYVDSSLMMGQKKIHFLPCLPENGFFPDLNALPQVDLIYICSPNNPTGAVATRAQLEELVAVAQERNALIIFDSAYAGFIQDSSLPRSIFEIEGAEKVAIETSSFSKSIGFTGVRLGWTIVSKALGPLYSNWNRLISTVFNGASCIAQAGGLTALTSSSMNCQIPFYLENARILKEALHPYKVYGGTHAPYLWVDFGENSWSLFQKFLEETHLVTTPGSGFGAAGEGFLRFSAFGKRADIEEAAKRLRTYAERNHLISSC